MIYFHLAEHKGLRDIVDSVALSPRLKSLVKGVRLGTISQHNNKRNYEVFSHVMTELIKNLLDFISVSDAIKKFGSVKLIDSTTIQYVYNILSMGFIL